MKSTGLRIGKLFGIEIYIHISWLFIFALVTWSLARDVGPFSTAGLSPIAREILAIITAFLFFASVLAHELLHSIIARSRGVPIEGITLFIFGGVSMFGGEAQNAPAEAWISAVGPLTSFVLGILFAVIAGTVAGSASSSITAADIAKLGEVRAATLFAASYLAAANFMLAAFNLIPAYPLDGGRVLHAIVWKITKNRTKATNITALLGRIIAAILIGFGIVLTLMSNNIGGGIWLTFIGWFLLQAGESERVAERVHAALRGRAARDIAERLNVRIAADQTAEGAMRDLLAAQLNAAPVFIGERFIGVVTLQDLVRVPDPTQTYVTAVMRHAEDLATIEADADADGVALLLTKNGQQIVPVVDATNDIVGFITRESIVRSLVAHRATSLPAPPSDPQ